MLSLTLRTHQRPEKHPYTTHKCRKVSTVSNGVPYLFKFLCHTSLNCDSLLFVLYKQSLILLNLDQFELIYGPFKCDYKVCTL